MILGSSLNINGRTSKRRIATALVAGTVALGIGSVGATDSAHAVQSASVTNSTAAVSTAAHGILKAPAAVQQVAIAGFAYSPASLTVSVGTTVTWTNGDRAPHTVTSSGSGPLASPTLHQGGTYSYTFTQPGTYAYYCAIHPFMHGTVTVK